MQYAQPKYQGDPTIASLANGLGTLGRYGDSYMVHAAEGETVIPAEILAANPELKNQLFLQMRMMGIQDPNRYVVGNNLNSINPITGQPEFFFKKIFKAIKKVFKETLPVIAPIMGNLIAPGIGGIIASGLATKLQGGSWGDVAKSAALTYGVGALGRGLQGGIAGLGQEGPGFFSGFGTGLGEGLTAPWSAARNLLETGATNPLAQGVFGPRGTGWAFKNLADSDFADQPFGGGTGGMDKIFPRYQTGEQLGSMDLASGMLPRPYEIVGTTRAAGQPQYKLGQKTPFFTPEDQRLKNVAAARQDMRTGTGRGTTQAAVSPGNASSYNVGEKVDGFTVVEGISKDRKTLEKFFQKTPTPFFSVEGAKELGSKAVGNLGLPLAFGAVAYFMTPDVDDPSRKELERLTDPQQAAYNQYIERGRLKDEKGLSLLVEAGISPTQSAETLSANWGITQENAQVFLDSFYGAPKARGGIVGLQGGGEIMGAGTGTSDSIPARLSDGEFVMTADAVRGIGNGNRNLGAARMYDLMSRYENGVV